MADPAAEVVTPAAYLLCYVRRDIAEGWAAAVAAAGDPPPVRVTGARPLDVSDVLPLPRDAAAVDVAPLRAAMSGGNLQVDTFGAFDSLLDRCSVQ